MCRDGQEASVATPAGRAACRARHSRAPWHRPRCWRGLSPGMVLAGSPPGSCLHLFLTLLGFSFLLLSIYCFIACSPPASPSRNAPLHKSLLVLLLRASGALLPARPVPKSPSTHRQRQPVSNAPYSKRAGLGCPSFRVPSWGTEDTDLLPGCRGLGWAGP